MLKKLKNNAESNKKDNIKSKFFYFLYFLSVLLIFQISLAVSPVMAQKLEKDPTKTPADTGKQIGSNNPLNPNFQIVSCDGVKVPCDYDQVILTATRLIQLVLYLLIPVVLGMVLYIGFKFLTAGGDTAKLADAKRMVKPVLVGVVLIFGAWLIVYTILGRLLSDEFSGVKKADIVPSSFLNK